MVRYSTGAVLLLIGGSIFGALSFAKVTPNLTRSLSAPAFITSEYLEPARGRVASFTPPKGFDPAVPFIKRIAGVPGDLVEVKGDEVFVGGKSVGKAMPETRGGDPLVIIPEGVIAPDHFFMAGETATSLDSRYAFVGYIHRERIQRVGWDMPWAETLLPTFSAARAQAQVSGAAHELATSP